MTDKEMQKIKDSLPEWAKQNEEEQKLDEELDCRDMINSILIYGDLNKTIDEIYENKYLRNHKEVLSEERIKELIKEQQDDLKKSKINSNVYTDGEGVTYSSVAWYDEDNDKQEESKSLNESLGDRYEVWERYFEDGEVPDPKGELVATFETYAEAVKYMEGLMKDPDCEAWIVDTMQKESKELRKYNSRLYGVYDTEKEKYEEVGSLEDMKEKVESEKEEVEEKQEEPKEDKKDININITVKNENKEEHTQDYKDLYRELDELIKANATDKELNDFLENASFNEVITNNEYLALQKKAQNARMIDLKKESLDDKNIILSRVFAQYPDIDDEDEDYLNGLNLEELIKELKSRGWEDILEENKTLNERLIEFPNETGKNEYIKDNNLEKDKDYKDKGPFMIELLNENTAIKEESKAWIRRKLDGLEMTKLEVRDAYKEWLNNNGWTSEEYSFNDYLRDLDETQEWELIESKKIKKESLSEESVNPIINPEDKFYKDGHLYEVLLYPGAGVEMIPYYVYADYEQEAFDILLPYLLENAPGLVYDVSDLEDDDLDDYMSIDGNYYLDYNTRIEELEGEDKEKIETEFFKNYKEEE